jgi:hypothetical protein
MPFKMLLLILAGFASSIRFAGLLGIVTLGAIVALRNKPATGTA